MNTLTRITAITAMLYLGSVCYAASNEFDCKKLREGKLEEVINQKAETPEDFYCKANAYRINEQYDVAIILLNNIDQTKLSKKQKEQVLISLAATYRDKNDVENARKIYASALELEPSPPVRKHIEQILEELNPQN